MVTRKFDLFLQDFFSNDKRRALLVTGARQTGKTFSIRRFAKAAFKNFVEINFIEEERAKNIFENARNVKDILVRISALAGAPLVPGETLIFLDEVQEIPEIVTAIKFLVDEGSYRYVLSGSLLGVELQDIRSVPVGYMAVRELFPLDFEEFVLANGVGQNVIDALKGAFEERTQVDPFVHEKILELFKLYLLVGGMPAVVDEYIRTNNLRIVHEIQGEIITLYKKDIAKYDKKRKLYLDEIFDLIPSELNNKNKRFVLKNLNENIKFSRYENSFLWLKDAGAAQPAFNVEEPKIPLQLSKSRNLFKLFSNDVGLLACRYTNGIDLKILANEVDINFGSVYENAVAQELKAHGFDLYYFNSKKQGELDFVIEYREEILPIEVKSGKAYERHVALSNVLSNSEYGIGQALVLCNENTRRKGRVLYLPVYMAMFLHKEERRDLVYKPDLSGL